MSTPGLVSIVVNNHNYARFVDQAIDSALAQTHPSVEVIVVDDGSNDGSRRVIRSFGARVDAILKENGGQGSAYNAGFRRAHGQVVIFLDADDVLLPDTAARVVAEFTRQPSLAKVQYRLEIVDREGRSTGETVPSREIAMPCGDQRPRIRSGLGHWWPPGSGNSYARWALERLMPVPEDEFVISADFYTATTAALLGPIESLDGVGGCLRKHGANRFNRPRTTLDIGSVRGDIQRTLRHHQVVGTLARQQGLLRYPADPQHMRMTRFMVDRIVSLRLDPAHHPIGEDRRRQLALLGASSAWRADGQTVARRTRGALWFAAMAVAPRPLAERLAERAVVEGGGT